MFSHTAGEWQCAYLQLSRLQKLFWQLLGLACLDLVVLNPAVI